MATDRPKVLIIGSGIAGLSAAIHFSEFSDVILLTKTTLDEGNTRYAQGGIAAVWAEGDSFAKHKQDTLEAGAGLCRERAVDVCIEEGPSRVKELISWGVEFTRNADHPAEYDLHIEGGHHQRRILHAHDFTGLAIEESLIRKVKSLPGVTLLPNQMAIDLIMEGKLSPQTTSKGLGRCLGAYALDTETHTISPIAADLTVLASGGTGKVYLYT
jgi:L-aspartate oxidase